MQRRDILTIALVAVLVLPVASAYAPTENNPPAAGDSPDLPQSVATDDNASTAADGNYTRLYIEDGYRHSEVKPGESTTFNITVGNSEDHAVELDPHVVLPQIQGRPIEKRWVTVEDVDKTLEADEERTVSVTVAVPSDAELGEYRAQVAFTNETISYDGRPSQPVHAARINVGVFKDPTVTIRSNRYHSAQIQAGNSYTYEVVVENSGDKAVPLNPKLNTREQRRNRGGEQNTVERSWFTVDAPSEVPAGESVTVEVTVNPPESADIGRYDAEIELGLKDPARPDRGEYWQQVDLNFQVWTQPEEPFESEFQVSDQTDNVTLTLSASQYRQTATDEPTAFDVTFVAPDGTVADHQRVRVSNRGSVSLGGDERRGETQGPYVSGGDNKQFVYRVEDPTDGEWTVKIMPQNTTRFSYEIVRNES